MEEKITQILAKHYPGARVELERPAGSERVSGLIVWQGFEGKEAIDRQSALYRLLRSQLGPDAQQVSVIFTYTPHEFALMSAT